MIIIYYKIISNRVWRKTFPVQVEKEVKRIDKDGNESVVTISCKIKFIDRARIMVISLSNLVDNIAGWI